MIRFPRPMSLQLGLLIHCLLLCAPVSPVGAAEGDPVAIEVSADGNATVESFWGLSSSLADTSKLNTKSETIVVDRLPNQSDIRVLSEHDRSAKRSDHAMTITPLVGGSLIRVDGASILIVNDSAAPAPNKDDLGNHRLDALVMPYSERKPRDWIESLDPRFVMLYQTSTSAKAENIALEIVEQTGIGQDRVRIIPSNVAPISSVAIRPDAARAKTSVAVLQTTPATLPDQWESLFRAKEEQSKKSAKVFEKLSARQLNWSPPNGTHTPRWNVEHMMGRELKFFSQIFHQLNDEIPVMDLNPKQMPPDYVAAHPDWEGPEEARQIKRVTQFTRRFSYLMKDLPLDEKAPGSGWTPRRLLKQMDWHYSDHTSKTKHKFQLPEWPKN